jgi:hypothetical protein
MPQSSNGFFFDLPYALSSQIELFSNLFQGHGMLSIQSKIERDYIRLS